MELNLKLWILVVYPIVSFDVAMTEVTCYTCRENETHCINSGFDLQSYKGETEEGCLSCGKEYALLWGFIEAVNRTCERGVDEDMCVETELVIDNAFLNMEWEKRCCDTDLCNAADSNKSIPVTWLFGAVTLVLMLVKQVFRA